MRKKLKKCKYNKDEEVKGMFDRKIKTVPWSDIKSNEQPVCFVIDGHRFSGHMRSHGRKYIMIGISIALLNGLSSDVFASSGLDVGARKIYDKIINVGKWVIIVKGGIDCIQGVANGDLQETKKKFMGYLLIYALLFALPWAMDEIKTLFDEMATETMGGDIE
jgi:hypothetical protein